MRALVLFRSRESFERVRQKPMAALLVAAMLALAVAPPAAFLARDDAEHVLVRNMKAQGAWEKIPEEMREKTVGFVKAALPAGAVAKRGVWIFVLAIACFALLRGTRPELKLRPMIAAVALAMLPLAAQDLLSALTFVVRDVAPSDVQNVVLSNPAAWWKMDTSTSPAAALLRGLDFFELWSCWLVGFGVNIVAGTQSRLPYFVSFGLHAVTVAGGALGAVN
jgi:hypothetical protein